MYFCPNCDNVFNITKISEQDQKDHEQQEIDKKQKNESSESDTSNTSDTDSITDESHAQAGGERKQYNEIIDRIINGPNKNIDDQVDGINFRDFIESTEYKKLTGKEKELVANALGDVLPDNNDNINKKKLQDQAKEHIDHKVYFICKNCGYKRKITKQTLIFTKASSDILESYSGGNYNTMKYSSILPRTRKYKCPNANCESHDDSAKREAVFFRLNNTYKVKYICTACDAFFTV